MNVWKLRLSMVASLAIIFTLSTLVLAIVLSLLQVFDFITLGVIVVAFNIVQWLISPYIIDALYRVKEIPKNEYPKLHETVQNLSEKSRIKTPKLMLAQIPIPNAFAYGSPLAGSRIAVTNGLLKTLDDGEVEAVVGHELGHLKHRDVQIMMFVSLLPALFYYLGYSLMMSSYYGGKREGNNSGAIGMALLAFSMFLSSVCVTFLSRVREYYADRHSAAVVENGSQKLSTGLAKIVNATKNMRRFRGNGTQNLNAFKALFIADPDKADLDATAISTVTATNNQRLVQEILSRELTTADRIAEIFSTHPNIIKRLQALQELS